MEDLKKIKLDNYLIEIENVLCDCEDLFNSKDVNKILDIILSIRFLYDIGGADIEV